MKDSLIKFLSKKELENYSNIEAIGFLNFTDEFIARLDANDILGLMDDARIKKNVDVRKYDIAIFYLCEWKEGSILYILIDYYDLWKNDTIYRKIEL